MLFYLFGEMFVLLCLCEYKVIFNYNIRLPTHNAPGGMPQIPPRLSCSDPLSYFSLKPVLHDWCNKGRGMCYHVCGMVHIKEPLLLIGKSSLCDGFPFSLSEWSLTISLTPYNRKYDVLSASLNKRFPSFLSCLEMCFFVVGVVMSRLFLFFWFQ